MKNTFLIVAEFVSHKTGYSKLKAIFFLLIANELFSIVVERSLGLPNMLSAPMPLIMIDLSISTGLIALYFLGIKPIIEQYHTTNKHTA